MRGTRPNPRAVDTCLHRLSARSPVPVTWFAPSMDTNAARDGGGDEASNEQTAAAVQLRARRQHDRASTRVLSLAIASRWLSVRSVRCRLLMREIGEESFGDAESADALPAIRSWTAGLFDDLDVH